jgi:ubiquinone/menaquinone biosynthesis C-methylase UbiE
MTTENKDGYIPALGNDALTPFYDGFISRFTREAALKRDLIQQAGIIPGQRVLDLGCGTATLLIMVKQVVPGAILTGLDGDEKVLEIARRKVEQAHLDIQLEQGLAYALPYPDASFDRVLSSLVIHHLSEENKMRAFQEVFRILRPGGQFHIADFGQPRHLWARIIAPLMKSFEQAKDNLLGRILPLLAETGFTEVAETSHYGTIFGTFTLYKARKAENA